MITENSKASPAAKFMRNKTNRVWSLALADLKLRVGQDDFAECL